MAVIGDPRFSVAILRPAEVATLVNMPRSTVYSWMRPTTTRPALIHSRSRGGRKPSIPLAGLAEASVIRAFRERGMKMPEIASAVAYLRERHGEYALASPELVTDGVSTYLRGSGGELFTVRGQGALMETVNENLSPFRLSADGFVESYIVRRLGDLDLPAETFEIDPRFSAGRMRFTRTGVPVYAIAGLLEAGEDPGVVASEFRLTRDEVGYVSEHLQRLSQVA